MPDPVTMIITRRVKPGCEKDFESWLHDYIRIAERQPGHLGINIVRPKTPDSHEYTVIANYDNGAHLAHWLHCDEHARWIAEGRKWLSEDHQMRVVTGLETWFTPSESTAIIPPPRWKMFLVAWFAAWLLVWVLDLIYAPLIADLPVPLRALAFTGVIIGLMTFVIMPNMTQLFKRFLFPKGS